PQADERTAALIEELNHLRGEHRRSYRLTYEPANGHGSASPVQAEEAALNVAEYERRMRAITEQLHIGSRDDERAAFIPITSLSEIQRSLSEDAMLVEYYNDGEGLWAFVLAGGTFQVQPLPLTNETLNRLLAQLQAHMMAALKLDPHARAFTLLAQRLLQKLYTSLIEPLALKKLGRR